MRASKYSARSVGIQRAVEQIVAESDSPIGPTCSRIQALVRRRYSPEYAIKVWRYHTKRNAVRLSIAQIIDQGFIYIASRQLYDLAKSNRLRRVEVNLKGVTRVRYVAKKRAKADK